MKRPRFLSTKFGAVSSCLIFAAFPSISFATVINFNTDPNTAAVNIGLNAEVDGSEWNHLGIEFSTPGTLNVGCSSLLRSHTEGGCLGADVDFNDFAGTLIGNFVMPGTSMGAFVSYLVLDFCGCGSNSEISLFGIDGSLLTVVIGNFIEQTLIFDSYRISSFSIILGIENNGADGSALDFIEFSDPTAVPEPGTLALFGLGLAGMGLARRRKRTT